MLSSEDVKQNRVPDYIKETIFLNYFLDVSILPVAIALAS